MGGGLGEEAMAAGVGVAGAGEQHSDIGNVCGQRSDDFACTTVKLSKPSKITGAPR